MNTRRIISGGQTGVDRAGLDFAIAQNIEHGGWCLAGRRAADGVLDARYRLLETVSRNYPQRTKRNVQDADGTLIVYRSVLEGGSRLTRDLGVRHEKPLLLLDLAHSDAQQVLAWRRWLDTHPIQVLNVAGPSEGRCPGIYQQTLILLAKLWVPTFPTSLRDPKAGHRPAPP